MKHPKLVHTQFVGCFLSLWVWLVMDLWIENFPNISAEGMLGIKSVGFGIGERVKG